MATSNRIGSERRLERLEAAILTRRGDPQQIFSLHDWAPGALQVIEAVLGYVSGSRSGVVGVYQRHSFDAEKRAALEAWGAHVMALVEGRTPGVVLPMRGKR
jgi:hypothetical protein